MADTRSRRTALAITLALLGLNLIAFNYLAAGWARFRLDLTEDRVFSISPATARILESLDDDLVIRGYFSKRTHPKLAPLVPEIVDLLDEYRAVSRGRVAVEIVDPGEDEAGEQEANDRFGVESTPFRLASKYESGIVNAYFAVVVQYGDQYERYGFEDLIEVEPLPDDDVEVRLRNLEYDLTRAVKKVVYGFRSTAELFERVSGEVRFTAIVTPDTLPELFEDIPEAVRTAAAELEENGDGKFVFEEIVPADETIVQDVLQRFGARPMSLGLFGGDTFYLYGFLQTGERLEQLLLATEGASAASIREAIESSLRRQTPGFLKTVGVVAPDPTLPPEVLAQFQMQGRMPPQPPPEYEQVQGLLRQDYEVRRVSLGSSVPPEVDVLLVLEPRDLDEKELFRLDQYLMRGGRIILCAGNYEADFSRDGINVTPVTTGLDDWLANLGLRIPRVLVMDDRNQPIPIPEFRDTALGRLRTWRMAPYPYLVEVRDEGLGESEATARLDAVGIYWGSPVEIDEEKVPEGVEVEPLLRSSERSWTSDDLTGVGFVDYTVPEEGTEPRTLALAMTGSFPSFFADRSAPAGGADGDADGTAGAAGDVVLRASPETRLVVVANAEFLNDFVAQALGTFEGGFFTANLRFVENLIDWANLDSDMIHIRSRGTAARRIDRLATGAEVSIETANYIVPLGLLAVVGAVRFVRRRRTVPVVAVSGQPGAVEGGRS
jgi:ABC-2 type transport system permease protein